MQQESLFLKQSGYQLHLRHIWQQSAGIPVIMFHGSVENGRIFYTKKGKGLACYLARQGFDVYVADFRGRGESTPLIAEQFDFGHYETITQDIPSLINYVAERTGQTMHVICHSWGGVLFTSSLVRFSQLQQKVRSKICFGTKRQVTVWNLERIIKVNLLFSKVAPLFAKRDGYLNAAKLNMGSDNETNQSLQETISWVRKSPWIDFQDGFDYRGAAKTTQWPATWHLTGVKDHVLGHAKDVKLFIEESNPKAEFSLLSKKAGAAQDYDHIDILTHPQAPQDHFPKLVDWLRRH